MSIRLSLLAILDQGACYGYQLRAEFERRTGGEAPVNAGQVYSTLDRLERDGLVEKKQPDGDGQIYYAITVQGTAAVTEWFTSPVLRGAGRDELAIKVALAVTLPGVDAAEVIAVQRSALSPSGPATTLPQAIIGDARVEATEAERRWLDRVEERLASGADTKLPLSTEVPKRGRPRAI
ncbi:PadR family transcriptional regulator [Glaciihabitans arcticus]|uniref:PadR family transcriptional regulator n=1 Tax=Glaciihabitans arcticus TaxID=2668039 RepID=A0A4Q9GQE0_9MICO|nr:PadR family transcriptional regulator [Glaciihabitans arcticus]TBN56901.1 PadR family transcriptional regulator [Glaciihabitans arcticus]